MNLPSDERFVSFVDFNSFTDIGFFPKHLRIECCSHFLFLTTSRGNDLQNDQKNRLNLLLLDPFYSEIQVALFKANSYIDNTMFKKCDFPVKCCVQANMIRKRSLKFNHYLWTQVYDGVIRSKILKKGSRQIDSDNDQNDPSDNIGD